MIFLLSVVSGGVTSLALSPAGFMAALCAFALPLSAASTAQSPFRSALLLWCGAWGYFSVSLYWLGSALFAGPEIFVWLLPLVCLGFPAFIALFWAVPGYIAVKLASTPMMRLVLIILGLGISEYLRTILFTGFPWNAPAQIVMASETISQSAAYIGQHGLNFVMFMIMGAVVCLYQRRGKAVLFFITPAILVFSLAGLRSFEAPPLARLTDGHPQVRLVQPNVPQYEKWRADERDGHLRDMILLSATRLPVPQLVVLPETAIAGRWPSEAALVRQIARATTAFDGYLLSGIIRSDASDNMNRFYNSAVMLSHEGRLSGYYDKEHLVPFGEYVPFRGIPFIDAIAGPSDFSSGQPQPALRISPFGSIAILICYEVVFPDFLARQKREERPDLMVNLTNDGWFGLTAGPWQHLAQARMRAIEEGIPVMRAANTGISAGIDGYGRLLGLLPLGKSGSIDISVPPALSATFYSQNRFFGVALILFWLIFGVLFLVKRK
jgi:apolipoprotein N-acyltransferase